VTLFYCDVIRCDVNIIWRHNNVTSFYCRGQTWTACYSDLRKPGHELTVWNFWVQESGEDLFSNLNLDFFRTFFRTRIWNKAPSYVMSLKSNFLFSFSNYKQLFWVQESGDELFFQNWLWKICFKFNLFLFYVWDQFEMNISTCIFFSQVQLQVVYASDIFLIYFLDCSRMHANLFHGSLQSG